MSEISDEAVRAFLKAETPGLLDEHLDLAVKSVDGDKIRAGLAAALPYLLEHLAAEGWRKLPDIKVGDRVGYMWVPVLAGGGPKCIRGVVTAVYADGRVVADFEQPNLSAVAATMARIPPLTITAPADSFIRGLPVDDDLTVSSDTPPYLLEQDHTEEEPPQPTYTSWMLDLDEHQRPWRAHEIVRVEEPGYREVRITACGLRATSVSHPRGWWLMHPGVMPLSGPDDIHCTASNREPT